MSQHPAAAEAPPPTVEGRVVPPGWYKGYLRFDRVVEDGDPARASATDPLLAVPVHALVLEHALTVIDPSGVLPVGAFALSDGVAAEEIPWLALPRVPAVPETEPQLSTVMLMPSATAVWRYDAADERLEASHVFVTWALGQARLRATVRVSRDPDAPFDAKQAADRLQMLTEQAQRTRQTSGWAPASHPEAESWRDILRGALGQISAHRVLRPLSADTVKQGHDAGGPQTVVMRDLYALSGVDALAASCRRDVVPHLRASARRASQGSQAGLSQPSADSAAADDSGDAQVLCERWLARSEPRPEGRGVFGGGQIPGSVDGRARPQARIPDWGVACHAGSGALSCRRFVPHTTEDVQGYVDEHCPVLGAAESLASDVRVCPLSEKLPWVGGLASAEMLLCYHEPAAEQRSGLLTASRLSHAGAKTCADGTAEEGFRLLSGGSAAAPGGLSPAALVATCSADLIESEDVLVRLLTRGPSGDPVSDLRAIFRNRPCVSPPRVALALRDASAEATRRPGPSSTRRAAALLTERILNDWLTVHRQLAEQTRDDLLTRSSEVGVEAVDPSVVLDLVAKGWRPLFDTSVMQAVTDLGQRSTATLLRNVVRTAVAHLALAEAFVRGTHRRTDVQCRERTPDAGADVMRERALSHHGWARRLALLLDARVGLQVEQMHGDPEATAALLSDRARLRTAAGDAQTAALALAGCETLAGRGRVDDTGSASAVGRTVGAAGTQNRLCGPSAWSTDGACLPGAVTDLGLRSHEDGRRGQPVPCSRLCLPLPSTHLLRHRR